MSALIQKFKQIAGMLENTEVKEWKSHSGKVVGYLHSFIPEEIITAGNLLPYRLRANCSTGTELSDARFTQISCSFVRHCLDLALRGEMDFLDGIVASHNCDNEFRLYENWMEKVNTPFFHLVNVPKKLGEEQKEFYRKELGLFKCGLEEHFNTEITDAKLQDAIALHNETRRLQRSVYELMKDKNPPLTGAETLAVMVVGTAMPKERYNGLLKEFLEETGGSESTDVPAARIMLLGGEHYNPGLVEAIESQGGLVVADDYSFGARGIMEDIAASDDPLGALADYYLEKRPPSPRIFGGGSIRRKFIKKMIDDYKVDGVITVRLSFCDIWGFEQDSISSFLKDASIPNLKLEMEYILHSSGQIKTRVQAFIETLGK